MSELAAEKIAVAVTSRVLKLARQPYHRWLADPVAPRELDQAYRVHASFDAHLDDPEFGYRFLVDQARDEGQVMAVRTAWAICSTEGWFSAFGKKRARDRGKKAGPQGHDDHVHRNFHTKAADQLWLTDFTEHATSEGKLYTCEVSDVISKGIVKYSIDSRMQSKLSAAALNIAVASRADVAGCTLHSDRGSQFRSRTLMRALGQHDMVRSMGQV